MFLRRVLLLFRPYSRTNLVYELIKTHSKRWCSTNINVGTIGHIDHGKTTLTAAITKVLNDDGLSNFYSYEQIDKSSEEKARGITINATHVGYRTKKRHYSHTDCPGHADYIKNMICGTSQMDCSIVVVAATDGQMPQTKQHLILAKQIGIQNIIVFINKADIVSLEFLELVEIEMRDLLTSLGYDGNNVPVIYGSALLALQGDNSEYGVASVRKLLDIMDDLELKTERDLESPFLVPIDNGFLIRGRGTVVVGTIKRGFLKKNLQAELIGYDQIFKTSISNMEVFKKPVESAVAGDHVGILLRGIKHRYAQRGMSLCAAGSVKPCNRFKASIYFFTKEEGGRTKPILNKFSQVLLSDTWNLTCQLEFDADMILPGENAEVTVTILNKMALNKGQKFTIREHGAFIATGVIIDLLPSAIVTRSFEKVQILSIN